MPRRELLFVAMLGLAGCGAHDAEWRARSPHDPRVDRPSRPVVQLVRATLPQPITFLAVHYWFNAFDPRARTWQRWEVREAAQLNATSWGHIHRDLQEPWDDVGGGAAVVEAEWLDDDASRLLATLQHPEQYPDRDTYRYWPGPNSNTYAAWVLRESNVAFDLGPLGVGKDWRGWIGGGITTTRTGLHFSTPLLGLKLGVVEGIEIELLALTFGFAFLRPTLKTPSGSVRLPYAP
jgi:hypothetical protein